MYQDKKIWIGLSDDEKICISPKMANRHGLIAGATGTGKTVTLKVMAESFSACGVPVFLADVKGDLAGMCCPGEMNEGLQKRIDAMNLSNEGFDFDSFPTSFWDVYGESGLPLRTTISEMGPLLLARILGLNQVQTDVLTVVFKIADDEELLLIDTKDLKAILQYVGEHTDDYTLKYGNMTKQSLAAIVRTVVALEAEGGEQFFGEPALNISDWLGTDCDGRGKIQVLDCQKLILNQTMYSTFLLWMMSELFETLPEVGDREKPKLVFFFDEAHMLFENAPKALLDKIEQVVKLIRSKGVGIYFITQNPKDIPDGVLSQLGNKVQHALHAYTPTEQKAAKAAAQSFRENPEFDTYQVIQELGIGEALVSALDEEGVPGIVKRCKILPPQSQMGSIATNLREDEVKNDLLYGKYMDYYDRDSAYEFLQRKCASDAEEAQRLKEEMEAEKQRAKEEAAEEKQREKEALMAQRQKEREEAAAERQREREEAAAQRQKEREEAAKKNQSTRIVKNVANTAAGTIGREVGNEVGKTIGGKFGKRLGGNMGASLGRGLLSTLFKKK